MMFSTVTLFVLLSGIAVSAEVLKYVPQFLNYLQQRHPGYSLSSQKWPPKFCNKLDCPHYAVLKSTKDYELREYDASGWVSTNVAGVDYNQAASTNFEKLFDYISGKNAQKKKIEMTAPVLVQIMPGQGPACDNNFTMSFFMSKTVKNPPQPADKTVFLNELPKQKVYVRSFPGYITDIKDWIKEAVALGKAIGDPSKYHAEYSYTAGYNSPFQFFNRHNEIWFIAK